MSEEKKSGAIGPEDYVEPDCPISGRPVGVKQKKKRIPQQRVTRRLDELMAEKDYTGAERMLDYWYNEAQSLGDEQGLFHVFNERMGFYRKRDNKEMAYRAAQDAADLLEELGYTDTVSGATFYTNAATVYTAFDEPERSLEYFEKAKEIYEAHREGNEFKLAGRYNNMATALTALGRYGEADVLYMEAVELLAGCEEAELEIAVTYLNMLDRLVAERGSLPGNEEADMYLTAAKNYLETPTLKRDGYYSFMADKCVRIFESFGWNEYAEELKERIREIDERA